MSVSDVPEVMAIEQEVFSSPWTKAMFDAELLQNPFSYSFVVRQAKQIIGYLVFWEVADEVHLLNLAVAVSWQRQGVGSQIVYWMLDREKDRGLRIVTLEVRATNNPARSLYRKYGFAEVGIRKNYYDMPPEDAILLQYDLIQG